MPSWAWNGKVEGPEFQPWPGVVVAQAMASSSAVTDQLFGTLGHTEGALYQLPRKTPLRIEPKTYFGVFCWRGCAEAVRGPHPGPHLAYPPAPSKTANERTFLAWLSMATTLGTVATAIAGFAVEDEDSSGRRSSISPRTVELISVLLLPISVAMIAYALFIFYSRSENIRKKRVSFGGWRSPLPMGGRGDAAGDEHFSSLPGWRQGLIPAALATPFLAQIGFFDEKVGPLTVAVVVMISLMLILASAIKDVVSSR